MSGALDHPGAGRHLPGGWVEASLDELAESVLGKMLDKNKNRGEPRPYLRNINVQWGFFELDDVKEMRIEEGERERYGLRPGDLVVCEGGEPGRSAVWTGQREIYFQKALHRVRPRNVVDSHYLNYYLHYIAATEDMSSLFTGSTIKHLTGARLKLLRVPVAPRAEQDRIVEAVESAMTAVNEGAGSLEEARGMLVTLRAALLNQLMTADDAPTIPLADIAEVKSGLTKGRKVKAETRDTPFLRAANVRDGFLDLDEVKMIPASLAEEKRFELEPGDVLLVEGSGSPHRLGQGWLWEGQVAGCLHQNHVFRARPDRSRVLPEFLAWAIQAPAARLHFFHRAKTTSGLSTINRRQIGETPIPLPGLDTQKEIVRRLQGALKGLDGLEQELERRASEASSLRRSILHHAFTGRLVPQDPSDEPASELLERIKVEKAEREADRKATKGRKRGKVSR